MKKISLSSIIFLVTIFCTYAQAVVFEAKTSSDSILMGNYFELTFTLENASGRNFTPPVFESFHVIGGPNQSSMTSVINGVVKQTQSYTYYLEPLDIGNYYIGPASIDTGEEVLESSPLEVFILSNPDGIHERPSPSRLRSFEFFPPQEKEKKGKKKYRKKRKISRI